MTLSRLRRNNRVYYANRIRKNITLTIFFNLSRTAGTTHRGVTRAVGAFLRGYSFASTRWRTSSG